jgi:hypothetical protein
VCFYTTSSADFNNVLHLFQHKIALLYIKIHLPYMIHFLSTREIRVRNVSADIIDWSCNAQKTASCELQFNQKSIYIFSTHRSARSRKTFVDKTALWRERGARLVLITTNAAAVSKCVVCVNKFIWPRSGGEKSRLHSLGRPAARSLGSQTASADTSRAAAKER